MDKKLSSKSIETADKKRNTQPDVELVRMKEQLKGNYGIIYHIRYSLKNTTIEYQTVNILLSRVSGAARATIIMDDTIKQTQYFTISPSHNPEQLAQVTVMPNSSRDIELLLMPQAGGFYPVNIILQNQRSYE